MNLIKNSRAYFILLYLIKYSQMSYTQLSLIFGEHSYETTKDAMQKLVRAKYVEKISSKGVHSFFITELGYKHFCSRFPIKATMPKAIKASKQLDLANRRSYESMIYNMTFNVCNKSSESVSIALRTLVPRYKKYKEQAEPLSSQQIQGSTASSVFVTKDIDNNITFFFLYFLYDNNKIFNDTTEKNLIEICRSDLTERLRNDGIIINKINSKVIFILNSYSLLTSIVSKAIKSKERRYELKNSNDYIRNRGSIVENSFGFMDSDLLFLINDSDCKSLTNKLYRMFNYNYKFDLSLSIADCHSSCLCSKSIGTYMYAFSIITNKDSRGQTIFDKHLYLFPEQFCFIKETIAYANENRIEHLKKCKAYFVDPKDYSNSEIIIGANL